MQLFLPLIFIANISAALASSPLEDREAILAMAGNFKVTFDFEETYPIAPNYKPLSKPYHEAAIEVVTIAENTQERITLQHLLVVGEDGKFQVIKHWAQVWTWQDPCILDYAGSDGEDLWERKILSAEAVKGSWSQLVTSVDDTPRYEGIGKWTHDLGESSWISEPTRRPLPRREYEIRDDYDYLIATNRHTLTPTGWVHSQDNRKVVDREGKKFVVARETGLNQYFRTNDPIAATATAWWKENATVWNSIRNFWIDAGQQTGPSFSFNLKKDGISLKKKFSKFEQSKPAAQMVTEALTPYLSEN